MSLNFPRSVLAADALLDEKELSALLRLSIKTLRNWRSLGQGPTYVKLGKRAVRYHASAVQAFITAGTEVQRSHAQATPAQHAHRIL
jgi:predicted DNA-binding transcriptional regulator AlpA